MKGERMLEFLVVLFLLGFFFWITLSMLERDR